MTVMQALAALGFSATDLGSKNGKTLVRVMTDKGWAYERFATADDVNAWAEGKSP